MNFRSPHFSSIENNFRTQCNLSKVIIHSKSMKIIAEIYNLMIDLFLFTNNESLKSIHMSLSLVQTQRQIKHLNRSCNAVRETSRTGLA